MLELKNIYKTFNPGTINEKRALNGLNLKLNEGDFVTVIGGNGAGKSTMLNAVAGTWPVDEGQILIDNIDVTKLSEHKRAAYLGRVFQDPMTGTAGTMGIEENLALAKRRGKARLLRPGITKAEREEYKELFGDEFIDYNLVFCNPNGRPMEGSVINRGLSKLIKGNDLPPVVFHSLRHSSITYKLKLNGGDMKSVQGDSGHAQVKMVADVYSHILDDDRRLNAQRFEEAFYKPQTKELEQQKPVDIPSASDSNLIAQLLANPQLCAMLKDALLKSET